MLRYFNLLVVLLPDPAAPCCLRYARLAGGRRNYAMDIRPSGLVIRA
jgi:hypothetical protein